MSNGKVHMATNVIAGCAMVGLGIAAELPLEPIVLGSIAGTFITPDYDLRNNLPKSIICKVPIVKEIWSFIWWPYHKLIKHRSFWSHSPIFSTLIRIGYLLAWLLLLIILLEYIFNTYILSSFEVDYTLLLLVAAWCIQDITHILLDKT